MFKIVGMKRKLVEFTALLICFFVLLCSCDKADEAVSDAIGKTPLIAVMGDSDELIAAEAYSYEIGGDVVEYNLTSDAVVTVLNGKSDYVVINEFEAQKYIDAGNRLEFVCNTTHKIEYVAWFDVENAQLRDEFNKTYEALEKDGVISAIKDANKKGKTYVYEATAPIKGELVMLCDPLFEYIISYNDAGDLCGVDYDIANAICSYLGYKLTIETVEFDEMFGALSDGEGDFIMSATQYTPERAEYFLASDVYSTLDYGVYKRMV